MDRKDKIENYWKIYQMVNEWIRFSDAKAGILVTAYGVILTIIYTNADKVYEGLHTSTFRMIFAIFAAVLSIVALYCCFKCLNPSLKNNNPNSVFYFGHIASHDNFKGYKNKSDIVLSDFNTLSSQLSEQIFQNSKIAWEKFSLVALAIRLFFAVILLISIILISYLS